MGAPHFKDEMSAIVNAQFNGRTELKLLEAGCGSATHFTLDRLGKLVGIDISQEQLDKNKVIHEKILGDLQTYPLEKEQFDIVICWDVVEHLPRPQEALHNMINALKPGGVLLLGFPHIVSFKGLVTKFTPYWFHRSYYRFMKMKAIPFPTYMRPSILPKRVVKLAEENGCSVLFLRLHEGGLTKKFKERFHMMELLFGAVDKIWSVVSLGKSQSLFLDNCAFILAKKGAKVEIP
jgi:SAM-dependent methyltransferase